MSYQVLARKWRPRNFAELAGQEHVVQALTNALTRMRLHHAYLLAGTRGVGKTTIARILAKSLNCETGVTATPCGVCGACVAIDEGRFVDLVELDAASNTGIDNMREILDTARYAPTVGRYKVFLIDEVHMLSRNAFNSMLKTLEEPPEHVKFVLATTDPQKIPVTVLSRCLQFNLKQMPPAIVGRQLEHVLAEENIPFEPGAIRLLSRAARGSMRDGLSLLDQAIAYGAGGVEESSVRQMLGAVDTGYVVRLLEALADNDGPRLFTEVRAMAERNVALDSALQDLCVALHDIALLQSVPDAIADDHAERERLAEIGRKLDPEAVQLYYQIGVQGRTDLEHAPDEFAGFSMTLLRMLAFAPVDETVPVATPRGDGRDAAPARRMPPAATAKEPASRAASAPNGPAAGAETLQEAGEAAPAASAAVLERVRRGELSGASRPAATAAAPANDLLAAVEAPSPKPDADPARIAAADVAIGDWPAWVAQSGLNGLAHQLAYNAELKAHRPTTTGLEVELVLSEGHRHLVERMHQDKLRDALLNTLGVPVRLKIELGGVGEASIAAADRRARQQLQDDATASFDGDPFVRDALRLFEGRVRRETIQPLSGQGTKP